MWEGFMTLGFVIGLALGGVAAARPNVVLILADDLAAGRLVQVLPDYETPTRALHILFAATRPPTQTLRSFIDHVVGRFGKLPSSGKH